MKLEARDVYSPVKNRFERSISMLKYGIELEREATGA